MDYAWRIPDVHNVTARWFDQDGREIHSAEEAARLWRDSLLSSLRETTLPGDPWAGVLTMFVPFDLLPARDKRAAPSIYVTYERYTRYRFMRQPRVHLDYAMFAETRAAALAAHDQVVEHVRAEVARNRQWYRHIRIPTKVFQAILFLGAIWWVTGLVYFIVTALTWSN